MIRFLLLPLFIALVGLGVFALITENPDGFEAYGQGDYIVAREALTPIAEDGNDEAQYILGQIYEQGLGVPKDPDMALKWYRLAADQGHRQSLVKLSEIINQKLGQGSDSTAKDTTTTTDKNDNDLDDNLPVVEMDADKSPETKSSKTDVDQQGGENNQPDLNPEKATETVTETDPDKEATGGVLEMLVSLFDDRNISDEENTDVPADTQELVNQQSLSENDLKTGPEKETPPEVISGEMAGSLVDGRQAFKSELYEQALKILLPHAIKGNAEAQYMVGEIYRKALGVEGDEKKGLAWIKKAAEQGYAEAQYVLGFSIENNFGVEYENNKSIYWYRKAADQGHKKARSRLTFSLFGGTFFDGYGSFVDDATGHKVFEVEKFLRITEMEEDFNNADHLAQLGDSDALVDLGYAYLKGEDRPQNIALAIEYLEKGARDNTDKAIAMHRLGELYSKGKSVPQDFDKAVFWYKKAFDLGVDFAGNDLGELYLNRTDLSNNQDQAFKWFEKSAKAGFHHAQLKLAKHYYKDDDNKDLKAAFKWAYLAAEQENGEAQYLLAKLYEDGDGIPKDTSQAVRWFRHAVDNKNDLAKVALFQIMETFPDLIMDPLASETLEVEDYYREYYRGVDAYEKNYQATAKDIWFRLASKGYAPAQLELQRKYFKWFDTEHFDQVQFWLQEAAESGYAPAQVQYASNLAVYSFEDEEVQQVYHWYKRAADQGLNRAVAEVISAHVHGKGVPKSHKKAEELTIHYAEQGSEYAQFQLGYWYEHGFLVEKDLDQARKWYQKSADQDYWLAIEAMERLQDAQSQTPDTTSAQPPVETIEPVEQTEKAAKPLPQKASEKGGNSEKKEAAKQKETSRQAKAESDSDNEAIYRLMMLSFRMEDYELALSTGLPLAEAGDLEAQILISNIYANKTPPDYGEAFKWISRAAETGDGAALTLLASYYFVGKGVARDLEKAYELHKSAVAQKNPRAHVGLAMHYHYGLGVAKDLKKAADYYEKAGKLGESEAYTSLGVMHENGALGARNLARAQHYYTLAAKAGDQEAEAKLEELRAVLSSIPKPKRKPDNIPARPLPKQLAKETPIIKRQDKGTFPSSSSSGYLASSMEKYKELYAAGDYGKALEILHPFVEKDNPQALYLMADMYFRGLGVKRDTKQAFLLFERSALLDYSKAQAKVAYHYLAGTGTNKNLDKAYSWALKSAVQGDALGQEAMGLVLAEKDQSDQGLRQAVKWFRLAAEQGGVDAQSLLGFGLTSLDTDDKEGWMWLYVAAIRGDKLSKSNVDKSKEHFSESFVTGVENMARNCIDQNYRNCE
ncbi:tetratricopeptide repeat protein [uncultured Kiloniella sp.]|uniref:tetratricopeptide repeat protein n=1 Tax=uncultured Kiloniella sp. TaxID=1133091 RepID=UPI00263149F5|nr:tetratricopeptide repeat protein [uncultured Kiloniella sp.]